MKQVDNKYAQVEEGERNRPIQQSILNPIPNFYFSIVPYSFSDSIYTLRQKDDFKFAKNMMAQGFKWNDIHQLILFKTTKLDAAIIENKGEIKSAFENIPDGQYKMLPDTILSVEDKATTQYLYDKMWSHKSITTLLIPTVRWRGPENAYHQWLKKNLFNKNLFSRVDNKPVWLKIKTALSWTLGINLISLFFIYILGIGLGEYLFKHKDRKRTKWLESALYLLHSIPVFFFGMLLIYLFASGIISPYLRFFPTPGFIDYETEVGFLSNLKNYASGIVLPIICIVLPALAYLSKLVKDKITSEAKQLYVFKSWSEGNTWDSIVKNQIRKNIILPLIALIGVELPILIGGSVVIEVLFNIPGMGRLIYQSILNQDWPVVFNILLLISGITVFGKWLMDIGITYLDKRVKSTM